MAKAVNENCVFSVLTEKDLDSCVAFVHEYYTFSEPFRVIVDQYLDECPQIDTERIKKKLTDEASIGVFDKNGLLIATGFGGINDKFQSSLCCKCQTPAKDSSRYLSIINGMISFLEDGLLDELQTNKFLMIAILVVHPSHRRMGLASKVVGKLEERAHDLGIGCVVVNASSAYSQKLFEKLGYKKLRQLMYADFFDEKLQCKPFIKPNPPHDSAVLYFKFINCS